ncbi:MAG: hypothetical protein ACPGVK_00945 [Halocynthiibacter sp.]
MKQRNFLRATLGSVLLSTLIACSGGSSATSLSAKIPGFFLGRVTDQAMHGAYNPNGFSASQVQTLVGQTCQGGYLTGFSTQARSDGLIAFAGTCNAWKNGARLVEYERSGGTGVVIEITGRASGSMTYNRINTHI